MTWQNLFGYSRIAGERDLSTKANRKSKTAIALAMVALCEFIAIGIQLEVFGANQTSAMAKGWYRAGDAASDYAIGIDQSVYFSKPSSCCITFKVGKPKGFGTIAWNLPPREYLGKRVRMRTYIKVKEITEWAAMWMRVDGKDTRQSLAFDNMNDRPIKGTRNLQKYEMALDVSEEATNIRYGILIAGSGSAWVDKVEFETVDSWVSKTGN
jgi:hypothetical protein